MTKVVTYLKPPLNLKRIPFKIQFKENILKLKHQFIKILN